MTRFEITTLCLSVIGVLMVPLIGVMLRGMIRWIRTEDRLDTLIGDVRELVSDQDKVHSDILSQMKYDRDATNTRLRYLEEFFMAYGMNQKGGKLHVI